jgi:hypothetical protein
MNIAKAPPANTIIGNNHGHRISSNSNYIIWDNNSCISGSGVSIIETP